MSDASLMHVSVDTIRAGFLELVSRLDRLLSPLRNVLFSDTNVLGNYYLLAARVVGVLTTSIRPQQAGIPLNMAMH